MRGGGLKFLRGSSPSGEERKGSRRGVLRKLCSASLDSRGPGLEAAGELSTRPADFEKYAERDQKQRL